MATLRVVATAKRWAAGFLRIIGYIYFIIFNVDCMLLIWGITSAHFEFIRRLMSSPLVHILNWSGPILALLICYELPQLDLFARRMFILGGISSGCVAVLDEVSLLLQPNTVRLIFIVLLLGAQAGSLGILILELRGSRHYRPALRQGHTP
jgi:hypothetical protein